MEQMTNDVVRFMYENKISTATLGGHGTGAKLALATGCYHADRVTGFLFHFFII
jgi:pimeloyl-ACP methyl ester carboxylesterase